MYLGQRKSWRPDMEEGEARELLEQCLRVLFYRDCRALNKIRIAKATAEGTVISTPPPRTLSLSLTHPQIHECYVSIKP